MADAMFLHLKVEKKTPRECEKAVLACTVAAAQLRVKCDLQCVFAVQMVVIEPLWVCGGHLSIL